jgi:IclR family transcriptional regulator, acetate operon repressor
MLTNSEEARSSTNAGGVQSLHRALDLLEIVSANGGHMAIGEIAAQSEIPMPTIHRLLKTLVERGYMRQLPNRRYALGFRLLPLGYTANALLGATTKPALATLVAELGETANLAVLSEDYAEYVAQVPSPHAMRMFTEVGRRVGLHSTGVGKALLSVLDEREVSAIVRRVGLPRQTPNTITTEQALHGAIERIKASGYAIDEEEQELGVRCVAVPVPGNVLSPMAISVSGPLARVTDRFVEQAVPLLHTVAKQLGDDVAAQTQAGSR